MTRAILVALGTGTIITSAAAIGINAAHPASPAPMTRAEFHAASAAIERAHAAALARCAAAPANEREACERWVDARNALRLADLDERFRRTPEAARNAQRARIDVRYQAARARCAVLRGFEHDQCLIAAHAIRGRALLEAQDPYAARPG